MKRTNEEKIIARQKTTRKYRLKKEYNLTLEDYDNLLISQESKCAICGSEDSKRRNIKHLLVDHCHKSNKIRGLLCDKCNKILGKVNDDPEILKKMIVYLQK